MKTCTTCKQTKTLTDFGNDRTTNDGHEYACKVCRNKRRRAYTAANPGIAADTMKRYRLKHREALAAQRKGNREAGLHQNAKMRAKKRGLPFDIEISDIVIPTHCPVLGIPLVSGRGRPNDGSPSLDKYIPELGYVKGNVNVISHKANAMKSNATTDETRKLLEWMESQDKL